MQPAHSPASARGATTPLHAAVVAGACSPRLQLLLSAISSAPLTLRAIGVHSDDDIQPSLLQHRDIVTAVRAGDDQLAAATMRSHLLAARCIALRVS